MRSGAGRNFQSRSTRRCKKMSCELATSVLFRVSPLVKRHNFQLYTTLLLSCNLDL
jgi:hypothetical protein